MLIDTKAVLNQTDEPISVLERQLYGLWTQRKSYAPLCQLAPETITRIFFFTQVTGDHDQGDHIVNNIWVNFTRRWISCTRVCKCLRVISLRSQSAQVEGARFPLGPYPDCCRVRDGTSHELRTQLHNMARKTTCMGQTSAPARRVVDDSDRYKVTLKAIEEEWRGAGVINTVACISRTSIG
jgi:hypothetical protein